MTEIILSIGGKKIFDLSLLLFDEINAKHIKPHYHYGIIPELNERFEKIEQMMISFRNAHMNAMLDHFKIAISGYKMYDKNTRNVLIEQEFQKSFDQGLLAFDMVQNVEQKILVIKVIIVSGFFIFRTNIDMLKQTIDQALQKLVNIDKVRVSVADMHYDSFYQMWKKQRNDFVNEIQSIVIHSQSLLAKAVRLRNKVIEMKQGDDMKHNENEMDIFFTELFTGSDFQGLGDKQFDQTELLKYQFHFLFMHRINDCVERTLIDKFVRLTDNNFLCDSFLVVNDKIIMGIVTKNEKRLLVCDHSKIKQCMSLTDISDVCLYNGKIETNVKWISVIEDNEKKTKIFVKYHEHKCLSNSKFKYYDYRAGDFCECTITTKYNEVIHIDKTTRGCVVTYANQKDSELFEATSVKKLANGGAIRNIWDKVVQIERIYENLLILRADDGIWIKYPKEGCELKKRTGVNSVRILKGYYYNINHMKIIDDQMIIISQYNQIKILIPRFNLKQLKSCQKLNDKFFSFDIEQLNGNEHKIIQADRLADGRIISRNVMGELHVWGTY